MNGASLMDIYYFAAFGAFSGCLLFVALTAFGYWAFSKWL